MMTTKVLALKENGGQAVLHHYISLASPHLGARRPRNQSCVLDIWRGFVHTMIRAVIDVTGQQMLLEDGGDRRLADNDHLEKRDGGSNGGGHGGVGRDNMRRAGNGGHHLEEQEQVPIRVVPLYV